MEKSIPRYKIAFLGSAGVGKTSLIKSFANSSIDKNEIPTIGLNQISRKFSLDNKEIMLELIDTAGQEMFNSIVTNYTRNVNGIVFVFALNDHDSFDALDNYIENFKRDVPTIIIGNKNDLFNQREVNNDEIKSYAGKTGYQYFETSAENGDNVYSAFLDIIKKIDASKQNEEVEEVEKVELKKKNKQKGHSLCG